MLTLHFFGEDMMIHKLPSLAYDILDLLSSNTKMTQDEITTVLKEDKKSIKYAIRRLQENQIIHQIPDLLDMRIVHYRLPEMSEIELLQNNVSEEILNRLDAYFDFYNFSPNEGNSLELNS